MTVLTMATVVVAAAIECHVGCGSGCCGDFDSDYIKIESTFILIF